MATLSAAFFEPLDGIPHSDGRNEKDQSGDACQCYKRYHFRVEEEKLAFLGYGSLALLLLLLCALLAGLTLAICSLDMISLQVLSTSGNKKQRSKALVIARIKRNSTWFLCSMIMCSVACTESLPIIVQSLFGTDWLPIVISTIAVAVFAELLPQYLIPRNAILWGYYCWPFIWTCMWLTCIVSWPISSLLEKVSGPQEDRGIYTIEQLGTLIKFHERAEKHGGLLGPDTGRIIRGALNLDGRMLRGTTRDSCGKGKASETDVERGNASGSDVIVPWSSVRTVGVNEEVTTELVLRLRGLAYSRIPVVGNMKEASEEISGQGGIWKEQKVYGFLHLKNLVGLELHNENSQAKKLYVKDLPLYPLPVVRDDLPLYDLLNMFQLGVSRMAVVVPRPAKDILAPLSVSAMNEDTLPRYLAPLWSASGGLNTRGAIEMRAIDAQIEWTNDCWDHAQDDLDTPLHHERSIIGTSCPNPIGIVTYEDVVDAILQKTSRDEKDFFDRHNAMPLAKRRKEGDETSVLSNCSMFRIREATPICVQKLHDAFERVGDSRGTLRRRNISATSGSNNGEEDLSEYGFDGADDRIAIKRTNPLICSSSYTENSIGGFHEDKERSGNAFAAVFLPFEESTPPQISLTSSVAIPTEVPIAKRIASRYRRGFSPFPRCLIVGKATGPPRLRRTAPFPTLNPLNLERRLRASQSERNSQNIQLVNNSRQKGSSISPSDVDHIAVNLGGDVGDSSRDVRDVVLGKSHMTVDRLDVEFHGKVTGSQGESITNMGRHHIINGIASERKSKPGYVWSAVVKSCNETIGIEKDFLEESMGIRLREESFHDDRILLPSQRKLELRISHPTRRRISL